MLDLLSLTSMSEKAIPLDEYLQVLQENPKALPSSAETISKELETLKSFSVYVHPGMPEFRALIDRSRLLLMEKYPPTPPNPVSQSSSSNGIHPPATETQG